jgi:hypothetical protein
MGFLLWLRNGYIYQLEGFSYQESTSGIDFEKVAFGAILAMIALLIGYEAVSRLFEPVPIHFAEAIPVAVLGLAVNIASAWLLSGGHHDHGHGHSHHSHHERDETHRIATNDGAVILEVFEDGVPPRFRLRTEDSAGLLPVTASIETVRPEGARQLFSLQDRGGYLESIEEIPEPHAFSANVRIGERTYPVQFEEHEHAHRLSIGLQILDADPAA